MLHRKDSDLIFGRKKHQKVSLPTWFDFQFDFSYVNCKCGTLKHQKCLYLQNWYAQRYGISQELARGIEFGFRQIAKFSYRKLPQNGFILAEKHFSFRYFTSRYGSIKLWKTFFPSRIKQSLLQFHKNRGNMQHQKVYFGP